MRCLGKILALSVIFIAVTTSVTIANESFKQNSSYKIFVKQPLPAMPQISAPKIKKIVFNASAGIDPIITGPRS